MIETLVENKASVYQDIAEALKRIANGEAVLARTGVIESNKEITPELGEWLGVELFGWNRTSSVSQKGSYLLTPEGKLVLIKTARRPLGPGFFGHDSFLVTPEQIKASAFFLTITFDATRKVRHMYLFGGEDVVTVGRFVQNGSKVGWDLRMPAIKPYEVFSSDPRVKNPELFKLMHITGR